MPPPTQRWMRPSAIANVLIVSARSKSPLPWIRPIAPIEAPRPTGSSSAMRSTAAIFGAPVTEPPGKVARRISARPTSVAQRSLHRRDHVLDAGELPRRHELRPAHGAWLADAREVVPLEVDDHHVLGRVLLGGTQLGGGAARARALDRHRPDPVAAAGEEELRRGGHDRPVVGDERLGSGADAEARAAPPATMGRPANGACRCWTRLTWYTSPRAIASRTSSIAARYSSRVPRALPLADHERALVTLCHLATSERTARGERELRARLRGGVRCVASDRLRKPVAEVEVGDDVVRAVGEEAARRQPLLEPLERAVGVANLEELVRHARAPSRGRRAPRKRRPDRRSRRPRCRRRGDQLPRLERREPSRR